MTEKNKPTLQKDLCEILGCDADDILNATQRTKVDLVAIQTVHAAEKALEKVEVDSPEYDAVLLRWALAAPTIQLLNELRAKVQHMPTLLVLIDMRRVELCTTSEYLWLLRDIQPDNVVWPTLVCKGLQILQKED